MGVDATVYVIADYSPTDLAYVDACICLCRLYDDWTILESLPKSGKVQKLHLRDGSWVRFSDGTRPGDPDCESGFLFGDSYAPDDGFIVYEVASLAPVLSQFTERNRQLLTFILTAYPNQKFLIFWS